MLLRKDAFDERETDFYEALYTQSQAQFGAYVDTGTVLNNYAHIFDLLIRLRQVSLSLTYCLVLLPAVAKHAWTPQFSRCFPAGTHEPNFHLALPMC